MHKQNMKTTLCLLVILSAFNVCLGFSAATCPSEIPESSRKDCFPGAGSTEQGCIAKGCMWCEASYDGPPWCFYDDDQSSTVYFFEIKTFCIYRLIYVY